CSSGERANVAESLEREHRVPQSRALIRRKARHGIPAVDEFGASGFGRQWPFGAAEDRGYRDRDGSAFRKIDFDALRYERVGVRVAVLDNGQPAGQPQGVRIGECRRGEIAEPDIAMAQADGPDLLQAQPGVAGGHAFGGWAAD